MPRLPPALRSSGARDEAAKSALAALQESARLVYLEVGRHLVGPEPNVSGLLEAVEEGQPLLVDGDGGRVVRKAGGSLEG